MRVIHLVICIDIGYHSEHPKRCEFNLHSVNHTFRDVLNGIFDCSVDWREKEVVGVGGVDVKAQIVSTEVSGNV